MRRVYNIKCRVNKVSGILGFLIKGQEVEGFVIVDSSSKEDFDVFIGRKFNIRGSLTKAPFIKSIPEELKSIVDYSDFTAQSRQFSVDVKNNIISGKVSIYIDDKTSYFGISAVVRNKWFGDIVIEGSGDSKNEIETKFGKMK